MSNQINLFTIGFTQKNAQKFFETLKNAGVKRVIDTRLNNISQLAGFTKKADLEYFLKTIVNEERCIAGIDPNTGKWIRPVCDILYPEDGRIPRSVRLIEGREPELLDILEISLADTGNDFGFECENLSVLSGNWKCVGKVKSTDLLKYCENLPHILHNSGKYVNPSYLKSRPFNQRRTLQLIHATSFSIKQSSTSDAGWRGTLQTANGQTLNGSKITDPVLIKKLEAGYQLSKKNYLVTVSLGMPWKPPDEWEGEAPCWKLIAGVIEI